MKYPTRKSFQSGSELANSSSGITIAATPFDTAKIGRESDNFSPLTGAFRGDFAADSTKSREPMDREDGKKAGERSSRR